MPVLGILAFIKAVAERVTLIMRDTAAISSINWAWIFRMQL